jgi:hypothetical protein
MLINLVFPLLILGAMILLLHGFLRWQRARKRYSPLTEFMLRAPAQKLEADLEALDERLYSGVMAVILPLTIVVIGLRSNVYAWIFAAIFALLGCWLLIATLSRAIKLRLAIDGEQYTGMELNHLMRFGAWVYHDIPYQYGNIDHLIVSTGGIFTVETKTFRKPAGERESSRQSQVNFDGNELTFPHFRTSEPLEQARCHAKHVQESIRKNLGITVPVKPVVALPGWYVERSSHSDVWIINPKRGGALASQVQKSVIPPDQTALIANYIESVARSVPAGSRKMDPDAAKHYDFWNNRRFEERKLG